MGEPKVVQQWHGHVGEVGTDTFWAYLVPVTGEGGEQEAEIFIQAVPDRHRHLIQVGAYFTWTIWEHGHETGVSRIEFVQPRRFSRQELEDAARMAAEYISLFKEDDGVIH